MCPYLPFALKASAKMQQHHPTPNQKCQPVQQAMTNLMLMDFIQNTHMITQGHKEYGAYGQCIFS